MYIFRGTKPLRDAKEQQIIATLQSLPPQTLASRVSSPFLRKVLIFLRSLAKRKRTEISIMSKINFQWLKELLSGPKAQHTLTKSDGDSISSADSGIPDCVDSKEPKFNPGWSTYVVNGQCITVRNG